MFGKSDNNVVSARSQGVRSNSAAPLPTRGEAKTVTAVAEASLVFAQYYDADGVQKNGMFFKMGDEYYSTKDNDEWTKRLAPALPWMKKALDRAAEGRQPVPVATVDNVDVD